MEGIKSKQKTYSRMYFFTAILHLLYCILMFVGKCSVLAKVNIWMIIVYVALGISARTRRSFGSIFVVCGVAMSLFVISHYILLGPSYGFQYLSLGVIPLIFYITYNHGNNIKLSRYVCVGIFIVFILLSIICSNIHYPLIQIDTTVSRFISMVNIFGAFGMAINFMEEFTKQITRNADELMDQKFDIEESANLDTLTGLRNRRSFDEYMDRVLLEARGEGRDFSILMCDVDNFKHVNDTYGHDCGDQVLINIANIIKGTIRPEDTVFRWGGEEILIIVKARSYVAKNVAERCRKSIEESYVECMGQLINVTITIGGSSYYQGADQDILIKRADNNLYTGKNNGKNQVVM